MITLYYQYRFKDFCWINTFGHPLTVAQRLIMDLNLIMLRQTVGIQTLILSATISIWSNLTFGIMEAETTVSFKLSFIWGLTTSHFWDTHVWVLLIHYSDPEPSLENNGFFDITWPFSQIYFNRKMRLGFKLMFDISMNVCLKSRYVHRSTKTSFPFFLRYDFDICVSFLFWPVG